MPLCLTCHGLLDWLSSRDSCRRVSHEVGVGSRSSFVRLSGNKNCFVLFVKFSTRFTDGTVFSFEKNDKYISDVAYNIVTFVAEGKSETFCNNSCPGRERILDSGVYFFPGLRTHKHRLITDRHLPRGATGGLGIKKGLEHFTCDLSDCLETAQHDYGRGHTRAKEEKVGRFLLFYEWWCIWSDETGGSRWNRCSGKETHTETRYGSFSFNISVKFEFRDGTKSPILILIKSNGRHVSHDAPGAWATCDILRVKTRCNLSHCRSKRGIDFKHKTRTEVFTHCSGEAPWAERNFRAARLIFWG